jgi:type IV pilus assembly protein PilB
MHQMDLQQEVSQNPQPMQKQLLSVLLEEGLMTPSQLKKARQTQSETGAKLADVLDSLGYLSKDTLARRISEIYDIPKIELSLDLIQPDAVATVPAEMARKFSVIPISHADGVLTVAMADPLDLIAMDNLKIASGMTVKPVVCDEDEILEAIDFFFGNVRRLLRIHDGWRDSNIQYVNQDDGNEDVNEDEVDGFPTIRTFNAILIRGIEEGASDIHIEPAENLGRVRYRLDGVLDEVNLLPRHLTACLISRIKVLSSLDIAEKRKPQDGRFFVRYKQRDVDLRVATLPTIYGESCVLRLLDQSRSKIELESLGLSKGQRDLICRSLQKPSGMVIVTGPTGSGKTTTLCAMLNYVNSFERKIITLEDPVEYRVKVVNQVSINPAAGLTYASGLRSILRNDPDVVLVGEIRDKESATIAVQASLTGHLLLSTLHTNGTAETIMRFLDLGVEPFYVREVMELIIAQRLVRLLCANCKQKHDLSPETRILLGNGSIPSEARIWGAVGCAECHGTGYKGRAGVYEILRMTHAIRETLNEETTAHDLREQGRKEGMQTLWEAAVQKVLRGETSLEEIRKFIPSEKTTDAVPPDRHD